jgi:transcriptional regulator with XRE-family HTH domain
MNVPTRLPGILALYSQARIARRLQKSRSVVNTWFMGKALPVQADLPALADAIRMDLSQLAAIVAEDAQQMRGAV